MKPSSAGQNSEPVAESPGKATGIDLGLEFPVEPGFISRPPRIDGYTYYQWIVSMAKPLTPEEIEQWRRDKCDVPFELP